MLAGSVVGNIAVTLYSLSLNVQVSLTVFLSLILDADFHNAGVYTISCRGSAIRLFASRHCRVREPNLVDEMQH